MPSTGRDPLHVAAAAIIDEAGGRVLLARRPDDKHQGGLWELPGGKVEPGEDVLTALARELDEELGIVPRVSRPLIRVTHRYPERSVLLDVWRVTAFDGVPHGREGQPVEWVSIADLWQRQFPAANRPIVRAVSLPERYLITPDIQDVGTPERFLAGLGSALNRGVRLVQLRSRDPLPDALAIACRDRVHAQGGRILLNGSPERAVDLGFDGVHLSSKRLMALAARPLSSRRWVGVSCHNVEELAQAAHIDADFAVLSPVKPTPSHPDAQAIGWARFHQQVEPAVLPVYALGGVDDADLSEAYRSGGQGVAGIRGLWNSR
ncbi:MAG: Nudix family hydrolase [Gammaproteobacteria bacterium]|nr:Nudix family hydrolase [Gammaproteobacteria bacterium]MCP5137224.1 Nudix family hydrolase [Gammaproteobacteria bacterium]